MKQNFLFLLTLLFVYIHCLQAMKNKVEIVRNDNGYQEETYDIFRNFFQKKTHTLIRRTLVARNVQAYTLLLPHCVVVQNDSGSWSIYDSKNNEWRAKTVDTIFVHKNRYVCTQFGINNWGMFDCIKKEWLTKKKKDLHFVGDNYFRIRHHNDQWSLFNLEKNCIVIQNATKLYFFHNKYVWVEDFDGLWYLFSLEKNKWLACHAQKIIEGNGRIIVHYGNNTTEEYPFFRESDTY